MASLRFLSVRVGLIAVAMTTLVQLTAPIAAASTSATEYDAVYATASAHLGDQWKFRATGPNQFDC